MNSIVGKRIHYTGDICNAARFGIVTDLVTNRWGANAVILWDQDETIGWNEDGEAVEMNEPVTTVRAHGLGTGRWLFA